MPADQRPPLRTSPALQPGFSLRDGQYTIQSTLSSGGFGLTYLAQDRLNRKVALKECFPAGIAFRGSEETVYPAADKMATTLAKCIREFLVEAQMLASLDHPNIVQVKDYFEENGTAYFAMDFVEGHDLLAFINPDTAPNSPFDPSRVISDVLDALAYLHAREIVHRDIKPSNIRIDPNGSPILIDFGAARSATSDETRRASSFVLVSDGYSPPEQFSRTSGYAPQADLYAVGATLYHLIKGSAPPVATQRRDALSEGAPDPFMPLVPPIPPYDPVLVHLINRSLALSPADRPTDALEWQRIMEEPVVSAPLLPEPVAPKRTGWFGPMLIGATLTGVIGVGVWLQQPDWLMRDRAEMEAAQGALEGAAGQIADMETEMGTLEGANTALQQALDEAQSEMAEIEAENATLSEQITTLEADLAAALDQANVSDTERNALLTRIEDLRTQADRVPDMEATIEELQQRLDGLEAVANRPDLLTSDPVIRTAPVRAPSGATIEIISAGETAAWPDAALFGAVQPPSTVFANRVTEEDGTEYVQLFSPTGDPYMRLSDSAEISNLRFSEGPYISGTANLGGREAEVRVWHAYSGEVIFSVLTNFLAGSVVTSDGEFVIVAERSEDGNSGVITRYTNGDGPSDVLFNGSAPFYYAALAADGRRIIASGVNETITGSVTGDPLPDARNGGFGPAADDVLSAISPTGDLFATVDQPLGDFFRIFNAATEEVVFTVDHPNAGIEGRWSRFSANGAFSEDNRLFAIAGYESLFLYDISGAEPDLIWRRIWTQDPEINNATDLQVLENGYQLLLTPTEGPPILFPTFAGGGSEPWIFPEGTQSAVASRIGDTILTGGASEGTAGVWLRAP